jgi:hypothetical protein
VQTVMMCLLTLSTTSGRHGAMPWCHAMVRVMLRQKGRGSVRQIAQGSGGQSRRAWLSWESSEKR